MAKILDKWLQNPGGLTEKSETPSGIVNGVNKVFLLSATPKSEVYLTVFLNGLVETGYTFNLTTKEITFTVAPEKGQQVYVTYFY